MAIAPFGPLHFRAAEGSEFESVALTELDGTTPVATFDADGVTAPIIVSSTHGYVAFWAEPGDYQLRFTRSDHDDVIVETINLEASTVGLPTGTLATLDSRYLLNDGGAVQQWVSNTPAELGSVWSYQGVVYERVTDGTDANVDSSFIRNHWAALGADPTVAAGGELAATLASSTFTTSFTANQNKDFTGMTASPIIPSNGRGIYVDFAFCATSTVANNALSVYLYDVTANVVATTSTYVLVMPTTTTGYTIMGRWRLNPPAGARTYKLTLTSKLAATITVLGEDIGFAGLMTFTAR